MNTTKPEKPVKRNGERQLALFAKCPLPASRPHQIRPPPPNERRRNPLSRIPATVRRRLASARLFAWGAGMISEKGRDAVQIAQQYIEGGRAPIPIPARTKRPTVDGWQNLRIGWDEVEEHFRPTDNIGVLLGEPSGLLIDVDLDHPLAVELADQFLPETESEFGRKSKPRSHRLYRVSANVATYKRKLPKSHDAKMVVELRSSGCQTVFPGSIHEAGEPIEWHVDREPTSIGPADLKLRHRRSGRRG